MGAHDAGTLLVLYAAPMFPLPPDLLTAVDVLIANESEVAELAHALDVGDSTTSHNGGDAEPLAGDESLLAQTLTSLGSRSLSRSVHVTP